MTYATEIERLDELCMQAYRERKISWKKNQEAVEELSRLWKEAISQDYISAPRL